MSEPSEPEVEPTPEPTGLELVSTEKMLEELMRRHDHSLIVLVRETTDMHTETVRRWHGYHLLVIGAAIEMTQRIGMTLRQQERPRLIT